MMRRLRQAGALLFAAIPTVTLAFEAVDTLPYPGTGRFPAYPSTRAAHPTEVYGQVGIMHDSNAFRLSDGVDPRRFLGTTSNADTVMRYGVGIRHDQRIIGRQGIRLLARGEYYDYQRFNVLDHFAYGLGADWNWELGNDLSGTIGYAREKRLADPAEIRRPAEENVITNNLRATAAYRLGPSWRLRGGVEKAKGERRGPGREERNTDANSATGGIEYATPLGNTLGVEVRRTTGDAPVSELVDPTGVFENNSYRETETALLATYTLSPQLRFGGRFGRTKRDYSEFPGRDFDGNTGRLTAEWLPGNKTILGFEVYRELRTILDVAASHVLATGFAFGPSWAPTAKTVVSGRFFRENRDYSGEPVLAFAGAPARDDTTRGIRIGVGWEPVHFAEIGLGLERGQRTSNVPFGDFEYTQASLNARYRF